MGNIITSDGQVPAATIDSSGNIGCVAVVPSGDVYTVAWTDYGATSTVVGWAATPTKNIMYKLIGKTCFVQVLIDGTSNDTVVTFTLPYTSANTNASTNAAVYGYDNGAGLTGACRAYLAVNSSTVTVYSDMNTGAWTNTGNKGIYGQFWFEIA